MLEERGVRGIHADTLGHEVLGGEAFEPVSDRWPQVVIDGQIDRGALAKIVFANRQELEVLEGITHPLIFGRIKDALKAEAGPAVIEVPLLHTSLYLPIMMVDATDQTRIERAVTKGWERSDVERRMAAQPARWQWLAAADLVIPNHGDLSELKETVDRLVPVLISP